MMVNKLDIMVENILVENKYISCGKFVHFVRRKIKPKCLPVEKVRNITSIYDILHMDNGDIVVLRVNFSINLRNVLEVNFTHFLLHLNFTLLTHLTVTHST